MKPRKIYRAEVEAMEGYYEVTTYGALGIKLKTRSFSTGSSLRRFLHLCEENNPRFTSNWKMK